MNFSQIEMVDMIFILGECQRNCLLASRVYHERYPERRPPNEKSFKRLKEQLEMLITKNRSKGKE